MPEKQGRLPPGVCGCAEESIFLSALPVKGPSPSEGEFSLSCWELGLSSPWNQREGRRQETLSGLQSCYSLAHCDTYTSKGGM